VIKKCLKNKQGITLVELIVVLSLISLVLLLAFSIFFFGERVFRGGNNQHSLQTDVRFALEALTDDMRYATDLTIIDTGSLDIDTLLAQDGSGLYSAVGPYETYIFYDAADSSIVKLRRESIDTCQLETDEAQPLVFTKLGTPANRLEYQLIGLNDAGEKEFQVASQVLMLNILDEAGASKISGTTGIAVQYVTPKDAIAELQYPVTQLIGDNSDTKVEVTFNKTIRLAGFDVFPGASKDVLTSANVQITPSYAGTELLTVDFITVGSKPKAFVNNDEIAIYVDYGTSFEYQAFYTLTYSGSAKKWTIE
jgi:prepilin-type N-terminal cleavage/methylation domain-containing protein